MQAEKRRNATVQLRQNTLTKSTTYGAAAIARLPVFQYQAEQPSAAVRLTGLMDGMPSRGCGQEGCPGPGTDEPGRTPGMQRYLASHHCDWQCPPPDPRHWTRWHSMPQHARCSSWSHLRLHGRGPIKRSRKGGHFAVRRWHRPAAGQRSYTRCVVWLSYHCHTASR